MMWGWSHDASMVWWMVAGSVFWGIVVVAAISFLGRLWGGDHGPRDGADGPPGPPLEVARRRYAAGEIAEDEFQRIRDMLSR
jgi:uncharacterized membrane protein